MAQALHDVGCAKSLVLEGATKEQLRLAMHYFFGKITSGRKACRLTGIQAVEDDFELLRGVSRASNFPDGAHFRMDDTFPDDIKLEDFIANSDGLLVISEKVKQLLNTEDLFNNEILSVSILNHKGRKEKSPYWILHQVHLQPCIDELKSVARVNNIDTTLFSRVKKLALDESKIHPNVRLFRMARYPFLPMFRKDLMDKLVHADCTGIHFGAPEEWTGM